MPIMGADILPFDSLHGSGYCPLVSGLDYDAGDAQVSSLQCLVCMNRSSFTCLLGLNEPTQSEPFSCGVGVQRTMQGNLSISLHMFTKPNPIRPRVHFKMPRRQSPCLLCNSRQVNLRSASGTCELYRFSRVLLWFHSASRCVGSIRYR